MSWTYRNEILEDISQFPDNTYGFVYIVTHKPTGKSYIGKKILQFTTKVKLGKKELANLQGVVGRRPSYKLTVKESDWKTYYGSAKPILEMLKEGEHDNFTREIIQFVSNKKLLTYYECKYLFKYSVLEHPLEYFNDSILGKFYTSDFK